MKLKRSLWLLTILLVAVLILTACGGAAPEETTGDDAPIEEPAEEPAAQADDDYVLRWRTRPGDDSEAAVYKSINDDIVAGIVDFATEYEPGALDNYVDVLNTELASGTAPDIFWIPGVNVADFAKRGVLLDMRPVASLDNGYSDDDFYPGPMFHLAFDPETNTSGPVLWGLPRDASAFAMYLNLDLIEEAGASDPRELAANGNWNWDTFLEVAIAVNNLGDDIYGFSEGAWWGPYGYWMGAAGGGFFTEDRTACNLASPETLAGLDFQRRLYQDLGVAIPWGEDGGAPFQAGKLAMMMQGRWKVPGYREGLDFNWDAVALPDGPGGPSNWHFWGAYVVNADTPDPDKAWELLRALTSTDAQLKVSELGANIPSRRGQEALDAFLTFSPPDNNQAFLDGLANNPQTEGPLWAGSWPEYAAVMDPMIAAVLSGDMTIDEWAATICDDANKAFDETLVGAPPASTEKLDITLRWRTRPGDDSEAAVYKSINDDIVAGKINFTSVYEPGALDNYVDVLNTELASGTAPDIFWIPGVNVADFAKRGVLLDMRPYSEADSNYSDDDFYPGPMFHLAFDPETNTNGPVLWGLPRDASAFAMYLNLDLIEEAGASDPRELAANGNWNWDTFLEVAIAVNNLGDDIYGFSEGAWWGPYGYWMGAAGGGFFTEDRTACNLASPETLAGLDFQRRLYQDLGVAIPWGEDGGAPFQAGKLAMMMQGRWKVPGYREGLDFNWDAVALPDGPGGPSNWHFWGAYVVNANTEHPEQAWQLLTALTATDAQLIVAELGANIPSRRGQEALDAFLTFSPPDNNQAFLDGLANNPQTEGPLWAGSWPEYAAVMDPMIAAVLSGDMTIDEWATTICDEANKAFSE